MEGVGARLGRSSTRYGPATVFTGPVRKWKKKWVHISPSNKDGKLSASASAAAINGGSAADDGSGSHLFLYRWTPLSQNGNDSGSGRSESSSPSDDTAAAEEPPRRRFKYVPIAVLEEQKKETTETEDEEDKVDEDTKLSEADVNSAYSDVKKDGFEEKPDINDVPMEENQEDGNAVRQDLNRSTLDLSLNLNDNNEDIENDQGRDG